MSTKILLDEYPTPEDLQAVLDNIRQFNLDMSGYGRPRSIASYLRDEDGRILGCVKGELWGQSVHIGAVWVADSHRGKGYGSDLMRELENYAASRGHLLAYVETTSFQARPFYEKLGYSVFGELAGIADGHTLFFLRKDLRAPGS